MYKSRYTFHYTWATYYPVLHITYNINETRHKLPTTYTTYFYHLIYITISRREKANETPHAPYRPNTIISNFVQSMFQRIIRSLPSVEYGTVKLGTNTNYGNNQSSTIDCDLNIRLIKFNIFKFISLSRSFINNINKYLHVRILFFFLSIFQR